MFSKSLAWHPHEDTLMATARDGSLFIIAPIGNGLFELSLNAKLVCETPFDSQEEAQEFAELQAQNIADDTGVELRVETFFENLTL